MSGFRFAGRSRGLTVSLAVSRERGMLFSMRRSVVEQGLRLHALSHHFVPWRASSMQGRAAQHTEAAAATVEDMLQAWRRLLGLLDAQEGAPAAASGG